MAFHIAIVIASNYLVQLLINLLGFPRHLGRSAFPFIFLATDLTVRLIGKGQRAPRDHAQTMPPALVASYIVGVLFHEGGFNGWGALADFNSFVFRIAFASFAAYVLRAVAGHPGVRPHPATKPRLVAGAGRGLGDWAGRWIRRPFAPIAFWHSSNAFMAANCGDCRVDYVIKLAVSLLLFVPASRRAAGGHRAGCARIHCLAAAR